MDRLQFEVPNELSSHERIRLVWAPRKAGYPKLRKKGEARTSPFPRRTYPVGSVTGISDLGYARSLSPVCADRSCRPPSSLIGVTESLVPVQSWETTAGCGTLAYQAGPEASSPDVWGRPSLVGEGG